MKNNYNTTSKLRLVNRLLLVTIFFCCINRTQLNAQVNTLSAGGYLFTASSASYAAISVGTSFQSGATLNTNAVSASIPIGFNFTYNRRSYSSIFISNNGFITFGSFAPLASNIIPLSSGNTTSTNTLAYEGAIAGFGMDLVASTAAGVAPDISYGASGSDFVVQFTDLARTGNTSERITFQIRLTQTTNAVKIVYNTATASTSTTTYPQVGLRGGNYTDWNVLSGTLATTWTGPTNTSGSATGVSSSANTMRFTSTAPAAAPATGQTYTWTAPAAQAAASYATLPAAENFDGITSLWVNGTSTQDQPNNSNWRTWPAFGASSWRRQDVTQANSGWPCALVPLAQREVIPSKFSVAGKVA